ncbi:hypothetical protein RB195_013600 [Necator americanus]|uniref:C-type lectin domain-containing protein n=1 Tax=Necator americanus TaxID=51031 RepID=A0ABR1DXI6_NECAM
MVSPRLLGDLICAIFAGTIAVFVHAQEEEGWVTFDGNQYGFFDHEATFDEAEEICVQYGGHLVSIHSQAENDFVYCLDNEECRTMFADVSHVSVTLITLTPVDLRTGRAGASNFSICPDRVPQ